jgi:DNA-binding XRE family transcriptional regulator/quercetin dioxygenase-like cupin family protein
MTVRGLARLVDVSASLISQIETGKSSPSVSTLYAITAALDVAIEDVFGTAGEREARRATAAATMSATDASAGAGRAGGAGGAGSGAGKTSGGGTGEARPGPANGAQVPGVVPAAEPVAAGVALRAPGGADSMLGAAFLATDPLSGGPGGPAGTGGPGGPGGPDRSASSAATQGLRQLQRKRRVGPVVHADEREMLHLDSGVTWELLGQLPDTHVDFLRITYMPGGSSSGAGVLMRHSGTEWGHVLSGQLTLTLGFDQYVLNPGDSVSYDCSTPHSYANHGTEPAVGVWFVAERFR